MRLAGADVWFDEWDIRAGDSIPGKVNEGPAQGDTVVLLWSRNADRSAWVQAELETAIAQGMENETMRVIPVMLHNTALRLLLRRLRWVDLRAGDDTLGVQRGSGLCE